jgi:hypothetical protein
MEILVAFSSESEGGWAMRMREIADAALLLCMLAAWSCSPQQKLSRTGFSAVLIDTASKKPVPSARIILAPKKEGKLECTIDTSFTGVSNDRGEVRIPNVGPGEYVVFYNLSASLNPELNGRVVNYDPKQWSGIPGSQAVAGAISRSLGLGPLIFGKGCRFAFSAGAHGVRSLVIGHIYATEFDLAMIALPEGELLKVPGAGSSPVSIEIRTDLLPPSPTQVAPKTGQ